MSYTPSRIYAWMTSKTDSLETGEWTSHPGSSDGRVEYIRYDQYKKMVSIFEQEIERLKTRR